MKLKILFIIHFQALSFILAGQTKYKLDICSYQEKSVNSIKLNSLSGFSDSIAINKALKDLLYSYYEKGYLAASFDSLKKDSVTYKAYLNQGKVYKWAKLNFDRLPPIVLEKTGIRPKSLKNSIIKPSSFSNIQEKIIGFCENNGYPFASLALTDVMVDKEELDGVLILKENDFFTIDSLIIKGKAKISANFLSRYLDLKKGDVYSEKKIHEIKSRISQLPFLHQIRPSEISFSRNKATIFNYLDNAKANRFNGIIGFAPNNQSTGNLLLTGEVEVDLLNPFGKGESILFHWRKLESSSQSLDAGLVLPYILNSPVGTDFSLSLFKQDSSWLTVDIKAGARFPFMGGNYFRVFIENQSSSIIATSSLQTLTVLPSYADTRSFLYGIGIYYNSIDYGPNPHKGFLINSELSTGERRIIKNSYIQSSLYDGVTLSSAQFAGNGHIEFYQPVSNKIVVKLQNNSAFITNKSIFANEMYKIGGLNSLRGFDDKSIIASSYTVFTAEFRYLFEQNSNVFLFFDGCHFEKNLKNDFLSDNPYGFGVGTNFETKAGIFSLAYAIGKQQGNPINLRSAKIHFGFINRF